MILLLLLTYTHPFFILSSINQGWKERKDTLAVCTNAGVKNLTATVKKKKDKEVIVTVTTIFAP